MEESPDIQSETRTRHRSSTLGSLQDRTSDLTNTELTDSGCKPDQYYELNLSPLRYKARSMLLPFILAESSLLHDIQQKCRNEIADVYFAWTANFGSHTFYVLMLPIPLWFGYQELLRDLVFIIGWGIFLTGVVKDYLCLPRPKSPPLHRITMSHYTAKEYGCPSSHSANATGVTLTLLTHIYYNSQDSYNKFLVGAIVLSIYYTSLIFGRIYCGMHGFTDIITGSIIGTTCYIIRYFNHEQWDQLIFGQYKLTPLLLIAVYYLPVYFHPTPLEDCPCYEDSVAFMGVLVGLETIHYVLSLTMAPNLLSDGEIAPLFVRYVIPYSYERLGLIKSVLRLGVGVILVFVWKTVSKGMFYKILSPFFTPANAAEADKIWVYKKRNGVDIVVRMLVYAGVAWMAVLSGVLFPYLGLNCDFVITDYV